MHRICKSEAFQPGSDGHRRRREQDRRRRHLNHIIGHFAFAIRCSHARYSPLLLSRFSRFPPSLRTFRPNLCPRRMDHWSASKIVGKILASEPAPKTGAIPWLLSSADSSGSGILAGANVSRSARDKALRVHSKPAIAVLALMSGLGLGSRWGCSLLSTPAQIRTSPIRASGLYGALFVKEASRHFCRPLSFHSFVRPAPQAFFRPDRIFASPSRAAAVKDGASFSAAEGLSLTDASTAAGC